ncbi:LD-carboxypeptidase [Apilactobacillus sp. TMW 2.2459]|nr:LD-carboxypeptidase [Apilactobacillus xinyiensis]
MIIIPDKLKSGDEIRVIAPSDSICRVGGLDGNVFSKQKLEKWGFKVTFGKHINEHDILGTSDIKSRIEDLHAAFLDKNVKAIITVIGGLTSNELLPFIDFNIIKNNPKIICGFSDFTALANAIYAKTGLVTYYGPAFASLKMSGVTGDYQDHFWLTAMTKSKFNLVPSEFWASGAWYNKNEKVELYKNSWSFYSHGTAEGIVVGGNLDTFNLVQGTPYQPDLSNKILLVEFSEGNPWEEFSRDLASILQASENPKALLIGRFPKESKMTHERLMYVLDKFPVLQKIPVIYNLNVGHAQPIFTIPLGCSIKLTKDGYIEI